MVLQYLVACLLCLCLSSCKKQSIQHIKPIALDTYEDLNNNVKIHDIIHQEAMMLLDIPIPLYDDRIIVTPSDYHEPNTLIFGYKSSLPVSQLIYFFNTQMERYGWQHLVTFKSHEIIMHFKTPLRFCTILIKTLDLNLSQKTEFYIYIKKEEDEHY